MIQLARFEIFQKKEVVEKFKPLINHLISCTSTQFLDELSKIREWDRIRDDLYVWIPVLNRIDETLTAVIDKYGYKSTDYKKKAVRLICMEQNDIDNCVTMMEFTCRLLYNTENRFIYSSMDVMNTLLNCPNFEIKLCAIKILAIMGERYLIARERIDSENVLSHQHLKKKALKLALTLPSSVSDENGNHVTLVDLYTTDKSYPEKWSKLRFNYFIPEKDTGGKSFASSENSMSSNLKKFTLSTDDLQNSSLQQIFDKGMNALPCEFWYDFSLKVTIAKSFCDNSEENEALRNLIIRTKFNTVAYINTVYAPPQVSSKLFEVDPYTFNSLSDFISLAEPRIPAKLRLDCLFALECISIKHIWCSDIMRNLGGNLSHGTLFQILRQISNLLRSDSDEINEEYNVRFFYLISNLADVPTLHNSLLSAGLIPCLLDVISVKHSRYRRTVASATHLLEVFINNADATSEFITNDGFNALINSVNDEVNFALENPTYGKPSKYKTEEYTISFRQQAYIRSLLKLVMKLLKTDSGDRIRNLIDSSILVSMKKILENNQIFSYTLVTYTLDIIQRVINSEPTIYPVLVEAELIPYIFEHFSDFVAPSDDLLLILPDVISALCLNVDGLRQVKEKNFVSYLFGMITNAKYAKLLAWNEESSDYGSAIDELARHYPDLKEQILNAFCDLIRNIPKSLSFSQSFLYKSSTGGDLFYYSKEDTIINNEDNEKELEFWDIQESSSIMECFSSVFYGMGLENTSLEKFAQNMDIEDLIPLLDVKRPPFDFSSSQAMLNITDALQLFDEQDKNYAFTPLLILLENKLKDIETFLHHDDSYSFFLSSTKSGDDKKLTHVDNIIGELSGLTSLLYIITTVYLNFSSLSPTRLLQITDYFDENGFKLIEYIGLLFRRCAMEEMYIRECLPDSVNDETTPGDLFNLPPIKIYANDPKKNEIKDNKTSVKFKNTYETRFLLSKLQTYSSMLYRCFLRLTHTRNTDIELSDKSIEIRIFDSTIQQLVNMLNIGLTQENISFYLVLLHFNTYVMTYSRTAIANNDILQTLPAVLFYQKGGYYLYSRIIIKLFQFNEGSKISSSVDEMYFVKNTPAILSASCLINALSFINRSLRADNMETVKNAEMFYPSVEKRYDIVSTLTSYMKKLALEMIIQLSSKHDLFDLTTRSIPYNIYKGILTIVSNIFTPSSYDDNCTLYELKWELIPPSHKKIEILMSAGLNKDVAKAYLEEHNDSFPTVRDPTTFNKKEWDILTLKIKQYESDDTVNNCVIKNVPDGITLDEMREQFYGNYFREKFFNVLPFYPKLINSFAQTLLQILVCVEHPLKSTAEYIFKRITKTNMEDKSTLSSLIHIFGIILNDKSIMEHSSDLLMKYVSFINTNMKAEHVNTQWYSKALYAYEIILVKSDLPAPEKLKEDVKVKYYLPSLPLYYHIPDNIKQNIFNNVIRVGEITNFYSAVSIARVLLLYGRTEKNTNDIVNSGILAKLLKVIGVYQKYEKINFLEAAYLLLVRRCFESSNVVSKLIQHEIEKSFTTRTLAAKSERERELVSLLEEKPHIIARNPSIFVENLTTTTHLLDYDSENTLWDFMLKRDSNTKINRFNIAGNTQNSEDISGKRTGIVHLLLSQLMAAWKKDWLSEPSNIQLNTRSGILNIEKPDPSRNPVCAYMIFLLKVLVELVSSYKQCKYEFLTYDRRNVYTEHPKPRSTALNFFLYQILDNPIMDEHDKHQAKRREVVSMLARSVVVGFISSVRDEKNEKLDPKIADPDMSYIRKFTIEVIAKALKSATETEKTLEENVSKIDTWFNIISLMLYIQAPYLRPLVDANKTDADRYQICKMMIELNVPTIITDCMSVFDINYPFCKKLFNSGVEVLNAINSTRGDFENLFKVENHDEEEDVDEDTDKEDVTNMFKNSSLGMYDVDDIEEEDDADELGNDSLIGDDEDIAFVNNDGSGFEVVFSDDDIGAEANIESDYSNAESDYGAQNENDGTALDFGIDDEGIEIDMVDSSDSFSETTESSEQLSSVYNSEGENESEIDVVSLSDSDDINIDLSEYSIEDSAWESGISDLSSISDNSSESDDSDLHEVISRSRNGRRVWTFGEGTELEDESDTESRGVFQGIQHTFNPDTQNLFTINNAMDISARHHRSSRRNPRVPMVPPSLTLLNGNRRNQSNLINPLSPSGLEQVESEITEQISSIRSGVRPRTSRTHFADVLLSGELYSDNAVEGIVLKSSILRWRDAYDMFYGSKNYGLYLINTILNNIYSKSLDLNTQLVKERQKKEQEATEANTIDLEDESEIDDYSFNDQHINEVENIAAIQSHGHTNSHIDVEGNIIDHEPIYVIIDGSSVDIGGTDIDPEFFNALPDDMRSEVFAQHVGQRRAELINNSQINNQNNREIDPNFLEALPQTLRNTIVNQEDIASEELHHVHHSDSSNSRATINEVLQPSRLSLAGNDDIDNGSMEHISNELSPPKDVTDKKKHSRTYFDNLLDRTGIASLMKTVFIPQPYIKREMYHELFYRLCLSKQNRSDIINLLLLILAEGTCDQTSLEKMYNVINFRGNRSSKPQGNSQRQVPPDCTPLVVANQTIEILQNLIDSDNRLKFFFITEHDNLMINKTSFKTKKEGPVKHERWPIKYLVDLLERKLITDETVLMDLLTNILQTCTKPLLAMVKNSQQYKTKKKFQIPDFDKDDFEKVVSIINLDSCNTKVFQQTLNTMHHLSFIDDGLTYFTEQLVNSAKSTACNLFHDLTQLSLITSKESDDSETTNELVQKMIVPSSDQAKLLKILTAVDFLYSHKRRDNDSHIERLSAIYNKMELGKIWGSLSRCLSVFEERKDITTSATILLPAIESLMVVCKHSNMKNTNSQLKKVEENDLDFSKIQVENLFFPFTDIHKKLLNHMIRSNPKLMSGPFALLVKNPKILDFDNKRYYFIAKLNIDDKMAPKLPVSVRRDQVFLDSYRSLFFKNNDEIKNSKLEITFKGESGVDAGGLTREWYQVLSRQMFNPDYALFLPIASDKTTFHPNRSSGINPEHLSFFKFIGMIIAKSIRDQCYLDCHFSREVYKDILGKPVSLKDMESIDPDYYKSLVWILENDITDIIEETYSLETEDYGEHKIIDLVENGRNIPVTNDDKQKYVQKIIDYKLHKSVQEQMDNFLLGFYALIPKNLISIFDEQEIELLINGLPDIDVDDWKNNTNYVNFTVNSKEVGYFWRAVRSFDSEERAKLLQFVTGTSKVPLNGFKGLSGVGGVCKFSIHRDYGSTERLPSSHTCFNQLILPAYNSYDMLRRALQHAITEGSEGFGLA
ncbi:similar to Saccharomyces cerevisiae YDR457W TOM1 E3 ubiquitin ligase of the hect-domain class [Maudiozyma barnettii]|uniref:HECT-type E3 ubiquitin transferase n=1 Tax=Maudiozyma barnettii TaxID=61262 RepID=A0A8H2VGQ0_9SACH|nr:E3 ubiquitin-protein ligase TOM1 [Kazachstania barnettii]CAB4255115.1 similar to Saccharomyces cerevisiae YDR457W TOM1 E3 ubiquitin ligase of the hect-domain class [Kazachstania barnettii]CAD1783386.1 similar to Saccharomyces cerevisiae YDR457W TOM1 E3 ubiquitin ligase of the hect-domain class [Kazachstania barnettii]